jgi:DNA-binding winged helix-turn-helix (wHTH) protein
MVRKALGFRDFPVQLSFANCTLDLATRELRRDGIAVHLPPKAFALLEHLVRERPRVIPRAELDERLWPRSYVGRSSLGRLVAELRAAIGDDARASRIIRTVHGAGYAFCAEVSSDPATGNAHFVLVWRDLPFALGEGEHLIGREGDCRIVVDVAGVSRHHARIQVAGRRALIGDLASKNGTYVNRRRIAAPTPLEHLDEITLGTAVLTVRRLTDSAATQTVYGP